MSILTCLIAYSIMMILTMIHVIWNWKVLGYKGYISLEDLLENGAKVEAYVQTKRWQPVYNLIVFIPIAELFFLGEPVETLAIVSCTWLITSVTTDMITWILIPHPWQMSWKELFIDHQPWVSLCYLFTACAPFVIIWL